MELKSEKKFFKGQHKAIIEGEIFHRVQALMDQNQNKHNETHDMHRHLLSGKLFDNNGNQFKNQGTSKNASRKYRYYHLNGKYLSAGDLEDLAISMFREVFTCSLDGIISPSQEMEFNALSNLAVG